MTTTRKTKTAGSWHIWFIKSASALFVVVVLLILAVGMARFIWTHATSPTATIEVQQGCDPTSTEPCTAREALVKLAASVESGEKNVHPKVKEQLDKTRQYWKKMTGAGIREIAAQMEIEKAQWEQERYRELQRELQSNPVLTTPTPSGAISCDRDTWTRALCDRMSQ